jgi:predicted nucleotidyltransferase
MTYETALQVVNTLQNRIIALFGAGAEVRLFGSVARHDFSAESDIDVLVLLPVPVTTDMEEQIFDMAFDIELEQSVVFGIIVHSKADWGSSYLTQMPIHRSIEREGVWV